MPSSKDFFNLAAGIASLVGIVITLHDKDIYGYTAFFQNLAVLFVTVILVFSVS
jgi:hypothetical protein